MTRQRSRPGRSPASANGKRTAIERALLWRALPSNARELVTRPPGARLWRTSERRPACDLRTHTRSAAPPRWTSSRHSERPDPRRSWVGRHRPAVRTPSTSSWPSWRNRARTMSSGPPASTRSWRGVCEAAAGAGTATARAPHTASARAASIVRRLKRARLSCRRCSRVPGRAVSGEPASAPASRAVPRELLRARAGWRQRAEPIGPAPERSGHGRAESAFGHRKLDERKTPVTAVEERAHVAQVPASWSAGRSRRTDLFGHELDGPHGSLRVPHRLPAGHEVLDERPVDTRASSGHFSPRRSGRT
jgi:hypothetical protein